MLYLVEFQKTTTKKEIKQIKEVDHIKVKWEPYSKNMRRIQCRQCKRFGHGTSHCNLPPRCVKCINGHLTAESPIKTKIKEVQCTNCNENHPANYTKCPVYLQYLQELTNQKGKSNRLQNKNVIFNFTKFRTITAKIVYPLKTNLFGRI